jgi:lipopolysaccharide heptosyltransferase II
VARDSAWTAAAARLLGLPFRLRRAQPFSPPQRVLILKPCCLSQVLLTTPLLAALQVTFPQARFHWAISDWARPAIAGNPRVRELINTGTVGLAGGRWADVVKLARQLRSFNYDTCFIPSHSSTLALTAWLAGIPQRIGLDANGRGFTHTIPVKPPNNLGHTADRYLALAYAVGADPALRPELEFYPPDSERTAVTQLLVEQIDWLGETPLVIIHPGGGHNPVTTDLDKQWPVERYVRLANHLARQHRATLVLVGNAEDKPLTAALAGLISTPAYDLAGQLSLARLGALCEVADVYVGNDTGPTQVAAAVGCPTLAIFGPGNPAASGPYRQKGGVIVLQSEAGVAVEAAATAVDELLARVTNGGN